MRFSLIKENCPIQLQCDSKATSIFFSRIFDICSCALTKKKKAGKRTQHTERRRNCVFERERRALLEGRGSAMTSSERFSLPERFGYNVVWSHFVCNFSSFSCFFHFGTNTRDRPNSRRAEKCRGAARDFFCSMEKLSLINSNSRWIVYRTLYYITFLLRERVSRPRESERASARWRCRSANIQLAPTTTSMRRFDFRLLTKNSATLHCGTIMNA